MCGIAGWVNLKPGLKNIKSDLNNMLHQIEHRGPDSLGAISFDNCMMGCARLSIIDIKNGFQPISNEDKSIRVVYNGEIYNYLDIKLDLQNKGHHFKTNCDTEVLVHLYEEYGINAPKYINGNFAFAIYDTKNNKLILGRDRFGIRPLFYTIHKKRLYFASEIKSLFSIPSVPRKISRTSLNELIKQWTVNAPNTIFKNISQLETSHTLTIKGNKKKFEKFWDFPLRKKPKITNEKEAIEITRNELNNSVKKRLISEAPIGLYLSGGIDSSIICNIASRYTKKIKSYSVTFQDKNFDESKYQNLVSKKFGTEHFNINCSYKNITDTLPKVIFSTENPLFRSAPIPMYLLSSFVNQQNIKVVLSGEGADEAFFGYNIFKELKIRLFWSKFPKSEMRPILLKKLYNFLPNFNDTNYKYILNFFSKFLKNKKKMDFSHIVRWSNNDSLRTFLSKDYYNNADVTNNSNLFPTNFSSFSSLQKARFLEVKTLLEGYLLSSQGDRVALANHVEGRYPFLDHELWESISDFNELFFIKGLKEKWILKKTFENDIPLEIVNRAKQPYIAPNCLAFFSQKKLPDYVKELLSKNQIDKTGYFTSSKVSNLLSILSKKNPNQINYREDTAFFLILTTMLLDQLFVKHFNLNKEYNSNIRWINF